MQSLLDALFTNLTHLQYHTHKVCVEQLCAAFSNTEINTSLVFPALWEKVNDEIRPRVIDRDTIMNKG